MNNTLLFFIFVTLIVTGLIVKNYLDCQRAIYHPSPHSLCQPVLFEGKSYTECIATPGRQRITTRLTGANGVVYRGFGHLARDLDVATVAFAMNGGMYDESGRPIGYYTEQGRKSYPLNQRAGAGNFYKKPNGVFFGDTDGNWRILPTADFAETILTKPMFGTQSGPMLLVDGALAAAIAPNGPSLNIRNAVGVDASGKAHFVIANVPVSFGSLARMMRDHAKARNALFLDGVVSALWDPTTGRMDDSYPLGPLIVVTDIRNSTR